MPFAFVSPPLRALRDGALCIALALASTGCGEKAQTAAAGGGGGAAKGGRGGGGAAPVIVGHATRKVVPLMIDGIGAVEPMRSASIRSQVTGILLKIAIQEGQDVKEGDLLFELDPRPFQNALRSAEAELQKAKVQFENGRAQVARYRDLSAEQMISKEQFQKIQDDARALEAQVAASESEVATARLQLEFCSIRAPVPGRTGNLGVHEGDLVRANDTAALVTINQISPIYVTFGVPQQYLAALARYRSSGTLTVSVTPPGLDEKPEQGELTFIDNTVDPATGTIKLKGTFPNSSHRLWPGQFATVGVTLSSPEALVVPSSAIQTSQTGQHVYVVRADKTAELRQVTVERIFENETVIAKGLAPGETVVIDGQLRVIPNRPVEIKEPAASGGKAGRAAGGDDAKGKAKAKKET